MAYLNDALYEDIFDKNTKWADIPVDEVFEFDQEPDNIIFNGLAADNPTSGWSGSYMNGSVNELYELTGQLQGKVLGQYENWMNWLEKIQPDYRFLSISDENAETTVFANVDDPWMFTEYIFKGTGTVASKDDEGKPTLLNKSFIIIEPPLYDWDTLNPQNDIAKQLNNTSTSSSSSSTEEVLIKKVSKYGWYNVKDKNGKIDLEYYEPERYSTGADDTTLYKVKLNVECLKWGQHGNIPPHVLNISAPSEWIETATKLVPRPVYKASIGIPFYASNYGLLYIENNEYYIKPLTFSLVSEEKDEDGNILYYTRKYEYDNNFSGGILQVKPRVINGQNSGDKVVRKISSDEKPGNLIYSGCRYWKGNSGQAFCEQVNKLTGDNLSRLYVDCDLCTSAKNSKCPYFSKREDNIALAYYEAIADNQLQLEQYTQEGWFGLGDNNLTALGSILFPSANITNFQTQDYNSFGQNTSINYTVTYEFVETAADPVIVNGQGKENNKGVTVQRGTGKFAVDSKENAGVLDIDNIYFDDANQINFHRWLSNILPCYNGKFCNDIIGLAKKTNVSAGKNSGIEYKYINDMGEIVKTTKPYCTFYNKATKKHMGCPYNRVNRGASEFLFNNNFMTSQLTGLFSSLYQDIDSYQNSKKDSEFYVEKDGESIYKIYYKYEGIVERINEQGSLVEINVKYFSSIEHGVVQLNNMFGIQQYVLENKLYDENKKAWLLCKVKLLNNEDQKYNIYALYQSYGLGDVGTDENASSQSPELGDLWCIRLENLVVPTRDPITIDNEIKFIGGYHPQYKDVSLRGSEFLFKKEEYLEDTFMTGDYGIGDSYYDKIPQTKTTTQGYWIDESGKWIVDGRSLGDLESATVEEALKNKDGRLEPGSGQNGATGISNRKTNTYIDPETGETTKPIPDRCTVYSTDTIEIINALRKDPPIYKTDDDTEKKVPPHIGFPEALPRERKGAYCQVCKTTLALRFLNDSEGKTRLCPWCGTELVETSLTQFLRVKAMGNVSIYGLPGTVIKTDTYFWKNPTIIANTLVSQMIFKLGDYKTSNANKDTEKIDRVDPEEAKGFYKMGLPLTEIYDSKANSDKKSFDTSVANKTIMSNPVMNEKITEFDTEDTNNKYINPFTKDSIGSHQLSDFEPFKSEKGLKMVTVDYIREFRNRLEPTLGYIIGGSVSVSDYKLNRASYNNRKEVDYKRAWIKQRCTVPPIVLAHQNGTECVVYYYSGDPGIGTVKEYYPPSAPWWFKYGVIGGRATALAGSWCHFDSPRGTSIYNSPGDRTSSDAFICIHGGVPLDKEIVAAYLVVEPNGMDATKYPIGLGYNGRVHYQHYHAFTTGALHEAAGNHLHGEDSYPKHPELLYGYDPETGKEDPNSIWLSDKTNYKIDKYGDKFYVDEYGFPVYIRKTPIVESKTLDIVEFAWKKENVPYVTQLSPIDIDNVLSGINHYKDKDYGKTDPWGYLEWDGFGSDVIQKKQENEMWKTLTLEEFNELNDRYLTDCTLVVDSGDGDIIEQDFQRYYPKYVSEFLPQQMQNIPNYFNYSGMNSAGLQNAVINKVEKKYYDTGWNNNDDIVIVQTEYDSTKVNAEAGEQTLVCDITSTIKKLYNHRIERSYHASFGKSLEEILTLEYNESNYTGSKSESAESKKERVNINKRLYGENGYLLNTNFWYPKTEDGKLPEKEYGEKYELNYSKLFFTKFKEPFVFKEDTTITISDKELKIEAGNYDSASICSSFNNIASDILNAESTTDGQVIITCNEDIKISGWDNLMNFDYDCNRIIDGTGYADGYHPKGLLNVLNSNFNKQNSKQWRNRSLNSTVQYMIIDLLQSPIESERRDWRIESGSKDYSMCYCPNADCSCNMNPVTTVGIWAKQRGSTFNGDNCPACGTSLKDAEGVTTTNNDGIETFIYDKIFLDNPIIKNLIIKQTSSNTNETPACSFSVYISEDKDVWECILNVFYNETTGKYEYYDEKTTNKVEVSLGGDINIVFSELYRGRYVKLCVLPSLKKTSFIASGAYSLEEKCFLLNEDLESVANGDLNGAKIKFENSEGEYGATYRIKTNQDRKLIISAIPEVQNGQCLIEQDIYAMCFEKLEIYGCAYSSDDLTIMPAPKYETYQYKEKTKLTDLPTQFFKVSIARENSYDIPLKQNMKYNDDLLWNVELKEEKYEEYVKDENGNYVLDENGERKTEEKTAKYYKVTGGNFYHLLSSNSVILPTYAKVEPLLDDNEKSSTSATSSSRSSSSYVNIKDFERLLRRHGISKSFMPTMVNVKAWYGNGDGLEINISADGRGPSYQVEKGTICKINTELPDNGASTPLADTSKTYNSSVDIANASIQRTIPWTCFNNELVTLDISVKGNAIYNNQFATRTLRGNERTGFGQETFEKDIYGDHCESLFGTCRGTIKLFGRPNTILSGNLSVSAPAVTVRELKDGTIVKERTGGLDNTGFMVGVNLAHGGKRKTLCWNTPYIVVYARERDRTEEIIDSGEEYTIPNSKSISST